MAADASEVVWVLLSDLSATLVVVESRDCLVHFRVEDLEAVFGAYGRGIVVAVPGKTTDDLVRDMIEVVTSVCVRLYGCLGARNRAMRAVIATGHGPVAVV